MDLQAVTEIGERLCVSFIIPFPVVGFSFNEQFSRLSTKVIWNLG